ncbi:MAG: protein-S-isoprenylcysteine methyltransferase [Gammaproteobacteria bacterium]|nr:MAG: protein-S-isoprenylcysteine methyltransferase [Gammaproteobacteria bacterium]
MKALELKIPPLLLVLITMGLMWLTVRIDPSGEPLTVLRFSLFMLFSLLGAALASLGLIAFRRAKTTTQPYPDKTTALVTGGIYRYTRNPMYLGFVSFLIGFTFYLDSVFALCWVVCFVLYLTRLQIIPEERALQDKFPDAFNRYKQGTRRWI